MFKNNKINKQINERFVQKNDKKIKDNDEISN